VKKLAPWDSPPTEAEMEEIKPLLTCIQALKRCRGGALSGTQLMAFFLQCRVQPLQHRLSKLWSFSGLRDSSRVCDDLIEKKDLDKRVRALTTLTKDHEIANLTASYFDSEHLLPSVCLLSLLIHLPFILSLLCSQLLTCFPSRITSLLFLALPFRREDLFKMFLSMLCSKPPRLRTAKMKMMPKIR
jgi:hypothetical protein